MLGQQGCLVSIVARSLSHPVCRNLSEDTDTVERTGGRLATFTLINLLANGGNAKVPCCAVAVSFIWMPALCCHGIFRRSVRLSTDQNFWHVRNSSNRPTGSRSSALAPVCTGNDAWRNWNESCSSNMGRKKWILKRPVCVQLKLSSTDVCFSFVSPASFLKKKKGCFSVNWTVEGHPYWSLALIMFVSVGKIR